MSYEIPKIDFFGSSVTRLILGGNPFSGNSHVSRELDNEMMDYYTTENIKKAVVHAAECGINTIQVRADKHIFRILRELRNEGNMPMWVAQTASEFVSFEGNINQLMAYDPIAIYHHGTLTDSLYKKGDIKTLKNHLAVMRGTGKPVGLGTHMPEVVGLSEKEGWDVDFYLTCVYNLSRENRVSSAITGKSNKGEKFDADDIPVMYKTIRSVKKPCLVFKILGAARRCASDRDITDAFREAFDNIKPCDAVIVGMFQKHRDQIKFNSDTVKSILHPYIMPDYAKEGSCYES